MSFGVFDTQRGAQGVEDIGEFQKFLASLDAVWSISRTGPHSFQ
jgi:hypothetical protein